jgi:DNA-directed RNA polymerase specialized sigma subunit
MQFNFKFKWERITKADVERLTRICDLTELERQLLELRRKGEPPTVIADRIGYSRSQMYRLSTALLEKILKEL